ncbi:MAG: adenosylcobinamide-GDP ribazoletransferase [Kordiimonadaceae bacterium]|nr:adenosylcobinamide-GDP ribazoletransferase [Kordiimonadaceae bacterium]MBT6033169.1 adenosylcobinamide-GDP ribazoletransferase [Kordiimonadaceae bacterium]
MTKGSSQIQIIKEDIAAAFMLLTRIPINWQKISDEAPDLNRCLWAYPLVGLTVALIGSIFYYAAYLLHLPNLVSILIAITIMVFLTGAFHEDGLADVADGFGGGQTKEDKLEIMRDSRIGTYGSLALILAISLKTSSLYEMSSVNVISALICAAMVSRFMIILVLKFLPPARKESLSTQAGKPSANNIAVAFISTWGVVLLLTDFKTSVIIFICAALSTTILCKITLKQIGGYTGDVLGAAQQISEISILVFLSAYWVMP